MQKKFGIEYKFISEPIDDLYAFLNKWMNRGWYKTEKDRNKAINILRKKNSSLPENLKTLRCEYRPIDR